MYDIDVSMMPLVRVSPILLLALKRIASNSPLPFGLSPNVSGLLYSLRSTHTGTGPQEALYWSKTSTQKATIESGQEGYYMDIGLDASRSSTIYGNGSKVQPRSIYALMIIKD